MKWGKTAAWPLLVLSLTLALSPPQREKPSRLTVVYCLDNSQSLSPTEREELLKAVSRSIAGIRRDGILIEVICFGEAIKRQSNVPERLVGEPASDLRGAIHLALAIIAKQGNPGKIALFTDGSGRHDFEALAEECLAREVPVFVWYLPPRSKEWRFVSLNVPEKIAEGVEVPLALHYQSNFVGAMRLTVLANQSLYLEKVFDSQADDHGVFKIAGPPLPPGIVAFSARVTGDMREENNIAFACTCVVPPREALLITDEEDPPLARALTAQKIPVGVASWKDMPRLDHPVAILDNPTPQRLKAEAWENYLREGGAILICGGENIEIPWAPAISEKRDLPPSAPKDEPAATKNENVKAEIAFRTAAIVFVIDHSESMTGDKLTLACEATLASISRLWAQDMIGVIGFNTTARWVIPLGRGTDFNWVAGRLRSIAPYGGTAIAPALNKAFESLNMVSAHIKHIIFLSDGQDESGVYARNQLISLAENMHRSGITLTAIGIGIDYDTYLMPKLASVGGGEFHYVKDYQKIPQIVLRDVDRVLGVRQLPETAPVPPEAPVFPVRPFSGDKKQTVSSHAFPVTKAPSSELLAQFEEFPPLQKYYPCRMREGAIPELMSVEDPLLLHWQWEKGKVMLWSAKTSEWLNWPDYPRFWARLLRFLDSQSATSPEFSLRCLPPQGIYIPVRLTAHGVVDCDRLTIESEWQFYRKGENEWEALVSAGKPGVWKNIEVHVKEDGNIIGRPVTAFALPFEDEVADLKVAEQALLEMGKKTRGGTLDELPIETLSRGEIPRDRLPYPSQNTLLWVAFIICLVWLLLMESH